MNWGRAKTILIIMFLATDIFLLVILMRTNIETLKIPQKTIQETVKIMSKNRVSIKPEQIPEKRVKNQNMIMRNFFYEPTAAAKKILGNEVTLALSNPEQYEFQYENSFGSLYIQGNGFRFQNKKVPVVYSASQLPQAEAVSNRIVSALDRLGFTKGTTLLYNIWEQDGIYHCDVMPVFENVKIYGISMHITADCEDILTIEGHWFEPIEPEKNEPELLLDITAVLTTMALESKESLVEITDISHGYYASNEFLNSREIAAVPIYVITDRIGHAHIYDARTGTKVE